MSLGYNRKTFPIMSKYSTIDTFDDKHSLINIRSLLDTNESATRGSLKKDKNPLN